MNFHKTLLIIILFTVISCKKEKSINLENYIDIVYIYDENDNQTFSHLSTKIIETKDSIGLFIDKYKYRFSYFISNKIDKNTLEDLYPDTLAIKKSLKKQIEDKQFVSNFLKLANPKKQKNEILSMSEVMEVASRFFVIVKSRNDFRIKICAGGNEFKDLNKIKDVSLIESVTYEAIVNTFKLRKNERPEFISNVRAYFSNAIKNTDNLPNDDLLKSAKNKLYRMMEQDESLNKFLFDFFTENSNNLPFKIKQ